MMRRRLKKMKLVMIGPYPLDIKKISGGVEAVTVYLIEGLKQISDLDIQVITCKKDIIKERTVRNNGVIVHYLPSQKHLGNITLDFIDKYRIRKKIKELKPDIIHFQNQTNYAYIGAKSHYPTVSTVHGIIHKEILFDRGLINCIRRFPRVYLEKISLENNNYIICVSPYAENIAHSLSAAKTYFIPNPISDRYFKIKDAEVPNRILCAAPISRLKNVLDLLKALNLLKEEIPLLRLHIAGEIRDHNYFKIISSYIKQYKLESNVEYLGHLSEQRLLKEYQECCILVLFSLHENSPMVIQQAMAAGKAVVATRVGGIPFLVEDGKTGFLVDREDIKELARKLKLLLKNEDLRRRFGKRAKQEALKRFKTEMIAQKTYKVYQEILNGKEV